MSILYGLPIAVFLKDDVFIFLDASDLRELLLSERLDSSIEGSTTSSSSESSSNCCCLRFLCDVCDSDVMDDECDMLLLCRADVECTSLAFFVLELPLP